MSADGLPQSVMMNLRPILNNIPSGIKLSKGKFLKISKSVKKCVLKIQTIAM